jgi:uncharacterized phage protein (TIGR01671 family)
MKREIKFRAWHEESRQMVYGRANRAVVDFEGGVLLVDNLSGSYMKREVILMQYTGLHDNNEKEIYSSDILKDERGRIGLITELHSGQVFMWLKEYEDMQRKFPVIIYEAVADNQTSSFIESCEVIGNIYENPELLSQN